MKPTFLLFHAENVNKEQDSVCHLVAVPVIEGVRQPAVEYFMNPEANFDFVQSGISLAEIDSFPQVRDQWPEIQSLFDKYDMKVSSAEGYAAHSVYGTLLRLDVPFSTVNYCNAKAICRRTMDEVSYGLDYLSYVNGLPNIDPSEKDAPVLIAERWCDFVLKGMESVESTAWDEFFSQAKIIPGVFSMEGFIPSVCKRDYSNRPKRTFDPSTVTVDADPENPLFGMNVVFTGKLEAMTRDEARTAVVKIGGLAPERLTQDTDYLVVGVQDFRVVGEKGLSGKMKTAAKYKEKGLPIEVIDENDFIQMLEKIN